MLGFSKMAGFKGLLQTQATELLTRTYHKSRKEVMWQKPKNGWTKLNFDASIHKDGEASIGGLFRNYKGDFLLAYAESIGKATITVAEFAALKRGLELALEYGYTVLWIEGDAKIIFDSIGNKVNLRCKEAKKYVKYVKAVMHALSNCVSSHVYREGNRAADRLAKLGHQFQEPRVWKDQPPDILLPILPEDAQGKIVLRTK